MEEERKPWDRQEGEPNLWYGRFDKYYRVWPVGTKRSILGAWRDYVKDTYIEHNKKLPKYMHPIWFERSKEWKWKERAEAWDQEVHRIKMHAAKESIEDMQRRHIEAAVNIQEVGLEKIESFDLERDGGDFPFSEARRYVVDGVEIERKARGLPDYLLEIANLSDEELIEWYRKLTSDSSSQG